MSTSDAIVHAVGSVAMTLLGTIGAIAIAVEVYELISDTLRHVRWKRGKDKPFKRRRWA